MYEVTRVAWPQSAASYSGVNQRMRNSSSLGLFETKTVSERLNWAAISCFFSSGMSL